MEKEHNKIGKFAEYFIAYLFSLDLSSFKDLNFLLKELPNIKIKDGYGLDAFDCGSEKGYYLRPYCYDLFPFGYYYPASQNNGIGDETYNDKLKIRGLLSESEAMKIPSVLSYFSVPFTEEGIMEAWMLDNLSYFLPREWHAYYDLKEFIFCSEDIKRLFPKDISGYPNSFVSFYRDRIAVREQVLSLEQDELFPSMTIEGDSAMICFTYWQDDIGLVKASIPVTRTNETVCFVYEKTTLTKLVGLSHIK